MRTTSKNRATLLASGALLLWAIEPLVVSELQDLPLFESLTIIFSACFLLTATRVTLAGNWKRILEQPVFVWIFAVLGICGSDFAYMLGANIAPVAHIDLIDYIWPFFIIVFVGFLPNEKFKIRPIIGGILGLAGVLCMLFGDSLGIKSSYCSGYILALVGVLLWGLYLTYSRLKPETPSDMVGIVCGLGALICLVLHLKLETTMIPTFTQGTYALLLGLAGPGLAYQLWDYGMKFGDAAWLGASCYFARMLGMTLLVLFGKEPFSTKLILSLALASAGVFISSADPKIVKKIIRKYIVQGKSRLKLIFS